MKTPKYVQKILRAREVDCEYLVRCAFEEEYFFKGLSKHYDLSKITFFVNYLNHIRREKIEKLYYEFHPETYYGLSSNE